MAIVSLFWDMDMAVVMPCENTVECNVNALTLHS